MTAGRCWRQAGGPSSGGGGQDGAGRSAVVPDRR